MFKKLRTILFPFALVLIVGCTVHPKGEIEERNNAIEARKAFEQSDLSPLPESPSQDDLVRYALLKNANLQQRYWEWRAAIEQIPQDGTQATNLALFAGLNITNGSLSRDNTTLGLGNDPMADIVFSSKLGMAAGRALENARAAGLRFRKAQFDLRAKVLTAYTDYALTAELVRLGETNLQLVGTAVTAVEAKNRAGLGGQQDLLRTNNELDLAKNDLAKLRSALPGELAALNALLDRMPDAPIKAPDNLPPVRPILQDDKEVLRLAAERNPELLALTNEQNADATAIKLAKLQYFPDISLGANTDLAGVTQSLAGMVTVPLLRYEAINAAVAQAEANLRAKNAMSRQAGDDLAAQLVLDLNFIRDADRQLTLLRDIILPRARQVVGVTRSSYEAGQSSLLDLLEAQRSLIAVGRMSAILQADREKSMLEIESLISWQLK